MITVDNGPEFTSRAMIRWCRERGIHLDFIDRVGRCRTDTDGRPANSGVMDARSYAVVLEPEPEGGYSAHIPAFRGAHTQGETVEEALSNARDVIAGYIEILTDRDEPIPPSDLATSVAITVPAA